MNIAAWLDRHARTFPDRPGIARGTGVHATFREWARRVRRVAAALRGPLGCAAGDRVALCMTNSPE